MAIMLDADVIIAGERGTLDLERWLQAQSEEDIQIAAVTVAELWHGVERAGPLQRKRREAYLQTVVNTALIIPYTEETAYRHAQVWAALEAAGKMIGFYDVMVAATALEHGSSVATFNAKHFRAVKGLKVIEPTFN